jgi:hypothetical protein
VRKECGQPRGIFGTALEDYCIMSYVLDGVERHLHLIEGIEAGLTGASELQALLRRMTAFQIGVWRECMMIDYINFNFQHTPEVQALVFWMLLEVFKKVGAHPDLLRATEWCARACTNQWVRYGQAGYMRVVQGMFSGVRGTNFLNTLLNVAYFRVAVAQLSARLGFTARDLSTIHQGDDVWIVNGSCVWAASLFRYMVACGFGFQSSKQLFDVNRAEFLRVLYSSEGASGYLWRAHATLVVKQLQNDEVLDVAARLEGIHSQVCTLVRRGLSLSLARCLWSNMARFWGNQKCGDGRISIPGSYVAYPRALGGLGLNAPGSRQEASVAVRSIPRCAVDARDVAQAAKKNMATAWVDQLSGKVQVPIARNRLVSALHRANATDSATAADKGRAASDAFVMVRRWRERNAQAISSAVLGMSGGEFSGRDPDLAQWLCADSESSPSALSSIGALVLSSVSGQRFFESATVITDVAAVWSSTPYRNLSTATTALGLPYWEVVATLCSLAGKSAAVGRGLEALAILRSSYPPEVCRRVINGFGSLPSRWAVLFAPVVSSWLGHYAAELSVGICMMAGSKDVACWDSVLERTQEAVATAAVRDRRLLDCSRF